MRECRRLSIQARDLSARSKCETIMIAVLPPPLWGRDGEGGTARAACVERKQTADPICRGSCRSIKSGNDASCADALRQTLRVKPAHDAERGDAVRYDAIGPATNPCPG